MPQIVVPFVRRYTFVIACHHSAMPEKDPHTPLHQQTQIVPKLPSFIRTRHLFSKALEFIK